MGRNMSHPFRIGSLGVPATVSYGASVREQLEQLLFTLPGDRVRRPNFGCGIQRLVFAGADTQTARAVEYLVASNIEEHLEELALERVQVEVQDTTLLVRILFRVRGQKGRHEERFLQALEAP